MERKLRETWGCSFLSPSPSFSSYANTARAPTGGGKALKAIKGKSGATVVVAPSRELGQETRAPPHTTVATRSRKINFALTSMRYREIECNPILYARDNRSVKSLRSGLACHARARARAIIMTFRSRSPPPLFVQPQYRWNS